MRASRMASTLFFLLPDLLLAFYSSYDSIYDTKLPITKKGHNTQITVQPTNEASNEAVPFSPQESIRQWAPIAFDLRTQSRAVLW